jgi:hypothetical protein
MINKIYDALKADPLIQEKVGNRIKFYEYPSTKNVSGPVIVIEPLDTPIPSDFADNKWLTDDYLYQIEVWSKVMSDTKSIAERIRQVMWSINFGQSGGGIDEWDKDFGIYRDARRYRGKVYVL